MSRDRLQILGPAAQKKLQMKLDYGQTLSDHRFPDVIQDIVIEYLYPWVIHITEGDGNDWHWLRYRPATIHITEGDGINWHWLHNQPVMLQTSSAPVMLQTSSPHR